MPNPADSESAPGWALLRSEWLKCLRSTGVGEPRVMSANGKYRNPEPPTVKWIVESRKKTDVFDIVLTYPVKTIDAQRKLVHHKDTGETPGKAATMSLEAYSASTKTASYKFNVLEALGKVPSL